MALDLMLTALLALAVLTMGESLAAGAESVRVDASSGVPRLMVDGKPARARLFWGQPGTGPVRLTPEGAAISFEFTAAHTELDKGTMHLRFGPTPGEIDLDDIRVVDVQSGQAVVPLCDFEGGIASFDRAWTTWPPPEKNTVGTWKVEPGRGANGSAGLHVTLRSPAAGPWPDFHIYHHPNLALRAGRRYRVSLWARAQPARDLQVAFYRYGPTFVLLGGAPGPFESQVSLAAKAGIDLVSFPVDLPWPKPGQPADFQAADAQVADVLRVNPQALLLPRIPVDPPGWWLAAHPEEAMVWDTMPPARANAVVASPIFRREAAQQLAALVTHLESRFGPHMAGYHPCGQHTNEWFYQDSQGATLSGYAPADLRGWRAWLTQRYADDKALQAAWGDAKAQRSAATIPTPEARRASPAGALRDPASERTLIDFAQYQQEAMADCALAMARAVRQASGGRKLVALFYGYTFEHGYMNNGPAASGHYALRRVLDSPDVDLLCAPISYFDRGPGGSAPVMSAGESVALAGKLWLQEDDTRTHRASSPHQMRLRFGVDTLEQSNHLLLRNLGSCAVRDFGTWWMDLVAEGWFNEPGIWEPMTKLKALDEAMLREPTPFRPEVAAVIDEASMQRVTPAGAAATKVGVYDVRRPLGRMGAPFGQYLLDDALAGRVRAKLYVMLTAWRLTPQERQKLREATRGSLRLWCYAPGFQEDGRTTLEGMGELTGFAIKRVDGQPARAEPTPAGRAMGIVSTIGTGSATTPLFAAADATTEETLATYPDGSAAVALRQEKDGWSLFVGPPGLTPDLLRAAVRRSGAHLWTQEDCNVYANGPFVVLHASQDGPVELDTGSPGKVSDVVTGESLGPGPHLRLPMKTGETRVLRVERP